MLMKNTWCMILGLLIFGSMSGVAMGQGAAPDRYLVCQQRAQQLSGYHGPVPDKYLPGGALKGAMRGAAAGAAIGWIGGKKIKTGKAAKRGAVFGALAGAIRRGNAKKANKRMRRAYEFELQACMSVGNAQ